MLLLTLSRRGWDTPPRSSPNRLKASVRAPRRTPNPGDANDLKLRAMECIAHGLQTSLICESWFKSGSTTFNVFITEKKRRPFIDLSLRITLD